MNEINSWLTLTIPHSQKDEINLFVSQENEFVEVLITTKENEKVLLHDKLLGSIGKLKYDQFGTDIHWRNEDLSFKNRDVRSDMAQARERHGYQDELACLKYHLANAINLSLSNRGFSRYLKKNLLGIWTANNFQLTFTEDKCTMTGNVPDKTILSAIPESGTWDISRNMLFVMNRGSGIRTQIVDLIDDKLFLPGDDCQLFFVMQKK